MNLPISVIVLTKNEQQDLPGCLETLRWSDDVHLFDSFSTDRTVEIAEAFGARVTQRKFDNWAAHQNWGLENLPFKYPWVFYIDADERVTDGLRDAMAQAVESPDGAVAFRVQRRDFFMDRWLQHVQTTPYYVRLFRPDRLRYERLVNPVSVVDGETGQIAGYLDHFPFSKGLGAWFERHNSYSAFEAKQIIDRRQENASFSPLRAFTAKDFQERRFQQKELFYRMPMRPLIKFLFLYVLKRGFLDGRAGFTYAKLQSMYETMIVLKTREIEANAQRAP